MLSVVASLGIGTSASATHISLAPAGGPAGRNASRISRAGEPTLRNAAAGKIQHVVYILQENRSFNNLFMGFKGAKTQNYGYDEANNKIMLQPETLATTWVQYEGSSVMKFMESTFGLAALAASDARAADPTADFFDFTQQPRAFRPFVEKAPAGDAPWQGTRPVAEGD
jgi:phospholipase C